MKKKSVMRRIRKLACIACLSFGLFMASCASTDAPASNAGSGSAVESQETANGSTAQSEKGSEEEREKTPIELIAEVEDPAQRYEQAAKMYDGIKKKVPENLDDAVALLKIMAKSSDLPKTDYNAKKDEVKGILDDLMKTYGGSYCFVNFNGNDISWIGVYDDKGNGIVKKDYDNQRTDLFHYEYDSKGNILYSEHGVINDGTEAINVKVRYLGYVVVPNDGKEMIVEQGDRYEYDEQGRVIRIIGDFEELRGGNNGGVSFIGLSDHNSATDPFHVYDFGKKEHADEQGYEITYDEKGEISKIKWNYVNKDAAKDAEYETIGKGDEYYKSFKWNKANPMESYFALTHRDDGTLEEYVYAGWQYVSGKYDAWCYIQEDSRDPIKLGKNCNVEFLQKGKNFDLKKWQLACLQYDSVGEKAYIETYRSADYPGEKLHLHTWCMNQNKLEQVMDVSKLSDDFTIYEVYRFTYDDWKKVKEIAKESFLIYQLPEEAQESGWNYEEHDSILSPEFQYLLKY